MVWLDTRGGEQQQAPPSSCIQSVFFLLEGVHNIVQSDRLSFAVVHIKNRILQNVFQKLFENTSNLLVNTAINSLDSSASGQPSNARLLYTLDGLL